MRSLNSSSVGLIVFLGCLSVTVFAQWAVEDSGCRTPDKGVGNCVPISSCQPMVNVLSRLQRPVPDAVLKTLQSYTCGASKTGVKVCCPSSPIILENSKSDIPDVSSHPNLNLLPKKCGYLDFANKIINGKNAAFNEFPWMALLQYRSRKGLQFACGGTIINKNYILTAAHCIKGLKTKQIVSVRVGEHSIQNQTDCETINHVQKCNPPVQNLVIEEVIPHPQYDPANYKNDIGLLRVSTMNFNVENVQPVCLPVGQERTKTFASAFVTGWGITNSTTGQSADILQKVKLPISDGSICTNAYKAFGVSLSKNQICAGGVDNKDSCGGDSGGPMVVPSLNSDGDAVYIQYGVVSFGPRFCGTDGSPPGVYTLVPYFMDWILDTLRP